MNKKDLLKKYNKILNVLLKIYNKLNVSNKFKINKSDSFFYYACLFKKFKLVSRGQNNKIKLKGLSKFIHSNIFINGNNNVIEIDENCRFNNTTIVVEGDNNYIKIGEYTSFYGLCELAVIEGTKIIIGKNCLFSSEIKFRTGDSHSVVDLDNKRINPSKDILVGDHVWIGTRALILKGSKVNNNSIVSAGAIVTKAFEESNVILAGCPAKIIKKDVNWLSERI